MIICTNCNHENPEGSVQCENCYAPLPKTSPCPNCGAFTQINAAFCGQCGYHLLSEEPLAFRELEDNSEDFLDPKDTIPNQTIDYSFRDAWDSEVQKGQDDIPPVSIVQGETEEIAGDSSDFEPEIVREVVEIEEQAEAIEDLEQFAFDDVPESDMFEPDLEPDLELDLEAELPDMPGIDDLEETTNRSIAEITAASSQPSFSTGGSVLADLDLDSDLDSDIYEETDLTEELEEINPSPLDADSESEMLESDVALDLDAEIEEPSLLDEEDDISIDLVAETIDIDEEFSSLEELETDNEQLDLAEQTSEVTEDLLLEENSSTSDLDSDLDAEITNTEETLSPVATTPKAPDVVTTPQSWSRPVPTVSESATQLQLERILLFHVQTGTDIELAQNLDIIRIGKPNSQIPPDIDVSGFPDCNIVSRVHANIRVEGNTYFIEDAGSSNGTYVNHKPLPIGNRHRLCFGDRISLGKGDLMTFIFKVIE